MPKIPSYHQPATYLEPEAFSLIPFARFLPQKSLEAMSVDCRRQTIYLTKVAVPVDPEGIVGDEDFDDERPGEGSPRQDMADGPRAPTVRWIQVPAEKVAEPVPSEVTEGASAFPIVPITIQATVLRNAMWIHLYNGSHSSEGDASNVKQDWLAYAGTLTACAPPISGSATTAGAGAYGSQIQLLDWELGGSNGDAGVGSSGGLGPSEDSPQTMFGTMMAQALAKRLAKRAGEPSRMVFVHCGLTDSAFLKPGGKRSRETDLSAGRSGLDRALAGLDGIDFGRILVDAADALTQQTEQSKHQ